MFRCLLYYTSDWADYRGNLCSKCWSTCHRFHSDQHESRCMACCIWHESYKDYSCGVGLYYCFENLQYVDHNVRSASNLMFLRRFIGSCIVYKFGDFCSISAYSEHVLGLSRWLSGLIHTSHSALLGLTGWRPRLVWVQLPGWAWVSQLSWSNSRHALRLSLG